MALSSKRYVIFVSLVVALGGFLMGFDASVISGVVKFIELEFDLTKIQLGWAVGSLALSATFAMMVAGPLSDRYGRKALLKTAALLYFASAISSALAPTFGTLIFARMIGGLGVGASLTLAPMYIAEISPAHLRGRMVSFNQLNIVIGLSVAFFTNYLILRLGGAEAAWAETLKFGEHNWRWMLGMESLPAAFYYLCLFAVPESPRWFIMKGRDDEGFKVFAKAGGEALARQEIQTMHDSLAKDANKEKVKFTDLFHPSMRFVLMIGLVVAVLQQITGINSVFFYAPMIFEQSGIGTDASFSQAIWMGLINLVFTLVAIALIDRIGRKPLLAVGMAGMALFMFVLAAGFSSATYTLNEEAIANLPKTINSVPLATIQNKIFESDITFKTALSDHLGSQSAKSHETDLISAAIKMNPTLILIGILGVVASFAASIGPVMWVLFSELFPNRIRGLAIAFVASISSAISFTMQLIFPWELATLGNSITFLIYGMLAAVGLVFILAIVPETKGKTLEELEAKLVDETL